MRTLAASALGGALSHATGGKFANGAVTAAFMWAFNHEAHRNAQELTEEEKKAHDAEVDAAGGISAQKGQEIVDEAATWAKTDYALVGAKSGKGVGGDCSGSTWQIYKAVGLEYEYATADQLRLNAEAGVGPFRRVYFPRPGDVVAFKGHVAIYKGEGVHGPEMWTARRIRADGTNVPYGISAIKWWGRPVLGYYRYVRSERTQ